jgi:hypothetical protein
VNHFLRDYILMTPWINDKLGPLASRGAYSLKLSARTFNVLGYRMTLDLRPLLRHHLRHLPRYFFLWKFSIFSYHHELFGLQATLKFRCIEFEPTHLLIGMSLCKVLTSLRSALRKRVSRSIPIVATPVRYLGSEVFNLIPHSPESILLVLPPFSVRFAFRLRKSRSWLAMTTVRPTIHVPQANC